MCLIESTNEGWDNSIPVTNLCPQPDYSVGFRRSAFTDDQLKKIQPFVGELTETSYFMATYYMYFPLLTCVVQRHWISQISRMPTAQLLQRATVELFKLVKRENEIDRLLDLAWPHSSEDIWSLRCSWRRQDYFLPPLDSQIWFHRTRWQREMGDIQIYEECLWYMDANSSKKNSSIVHIPPDVDFDISQSELHFSQQSNTKSVPTQSSQLSYIDSTGVTPTTSFTETQVFKRPRKKQ